MRTGAVIGAEALIRWQHPEKGLLPPAVFLPVIEEHPLSVELGEWVIDTALSQIEAWHAAGLAIPVSVNVGARQLQQANFVERLHELLAAHPNVSPSMLELELLETSALEDILQVSQTIKRCHMMGVEFALDDFGTGYSSLSYLKRLPVRMLKIDQSFVRDMLDDPDDLAILEGVIGLADAFQREVIAEGVETIEHGSVLLKLGCNLAQGYGIARPMPAEKIAEWARTWQPDANWGLQSPLNRADLPVLFAGVQHRAWMAAVEHYLKGERDQPLNLDHRECHVGKWLAGDEGLKHRHQPCFPIVQDLHQRAHTLAVGLCQLKSQGRDDLALAGVSELHEIRDALLAKLDEMLST